MLAALTSKIRPVFKYAYLVAFFTLLAGFFYPAIRMTSFDITIFGILTLFVGLAGSVMAVKSVQPDTKYSIVYLQIAGGLWITCVYMIYLITGII